MAPTSKSLWIHLIRASLCLLIITGALATEDCNDENGELGSRYCKDAFTETFEQFKGIVVEHPKRTGCCLSESLGICIKHSWTSANCDTSDQKIVLLIGDEVNRTQEYINKAASYKGTPLCGEFKREACGNAILHHFDEAVTNITSLNNDAIQVASSSVLASYLVALLGTFYAQHWL